MTSKERVRMAINHEEPDRVPFNATFVPEMEKKLNEKYKPAGDIGALLGNDMIKIPSGLENSFYYKDTPEYVCPFGITWRNVSNRTGQYSEISAHPLEGDRQKMSKYEVPTLDSPDAQDVIRKTEAAIKEHGKEKWIVGSCQCSVFEASWYLRGLDTFMMDMALDEDYADELMDKVMKFPLAMGLKFIDLGVDMVWLGDDVATQRNMMISPDMWRRFLKPRYASIFAAFKKRNPNIAIAYHSCGNLQAIVPELIEIGLDVLNPIQPLAMNPAEFKKKFGKDLTMYGAMDVQHTMPFGSPGDVEEEVKKLISDCGKGGGFILSPAHHIQSDTSVENVEAFYNAAKKHGSYNKTWSE